MHDTERDAHMLRQQQRLIAAERGWAVVTAMMVMTAMLLSASRPSSLVDGETKSSRESRQGEARLNLTEGALATELFQLSHNWPTASSTSYPDCTDISTAGALLHRRAAEGQLQRRRPHAAQPDLEGPGPRRHRADADRDVRPGGVEHGRLLQRRDRARQPRNDVNNNCQLWVRAEGTLNGKKRIVVAKVRVDTRPVQFPISPFVAGSFATATTAAKGHRRRRGHAGQVRCTTHGPSCVDFSGSQVATRAASPAGDPNLADTVLDAPCSTRCARPPSRTARTTPAPRRQDVVPGDPTGRGRVRRGPAAATYRRGRHVNALDQRASSCSRRAA